MTFFSTQISRHELVSVAAAQRAATGRQAVIDRAHHGGYDVISVSAICQLTAPMMQSRAVVARPSLTRI
jgi:hypothetical protein